MSLKNRIASLRARLASALRPQASATVIVAGLAEAIQPDARWIVAGPGESPQQAAQRLGIDTSMQPTVLLTLTPKKEITP